MIRLFHIHRFDPAKWEQISTIRIFTESGSRLPVETRITYTNTCIECGKLEAKKVKL